MSNKLRSKEDLVSIHNGCVCCSLRKDILSALAELHRRSEQVGTPYDNIVLETTGLADPAPVAFTFFTNPWAKRRFHLDSIVYALDVLLCVSAPIVCVRNSAARSAPHFIPLFLSASLWPFWSVLVPRSSGRIVELLVLELLESELCGLNHDQLILWGYLHSYMLHV